MKLDFLMQEAKWAFSGTSFSPEKRALQTIIEHSDMLEADINFLKESGTFPETIDKYEKDFVTKYKQWLSARAQCISTMIAGPSNFPVKRAESANNRESSLYSDFMEWRETWKKNTNSRLKREELAAAGGELGMAIAKLKEETAHHEMMKRVNKAYPAYKKSGLPGLEKFALSEKEQQIIIQWVPRYSFEKVPFQGYELRNTLARIKSTEARVKELERKEENAQAGNKEYQIPGGRVVMNYEADRIQIFNDQKPESSVIASYKNNGLNWSPFNKCWQRKITPNAIRSIEYLLKITLS